jgi:hypothetical protein
LAQIPTQQTHRFIATLLLFTMLHQSCGGNHGLSMHNEQEDSTPDVVIPKLVLSEAKDLRELIHREPGTISTPLPSLQATNHGNSRGTTPLRETPSSAQDERQGGPRSQAAAKAMVSSYPTTPPKITTPLNHKHHPSWLWGRSKKITA